MQIKQYDIAERQMDASAKAEYESKRNYLKKGKLIIKIQDVITLNLN